MAMPRIRRSIIVGIGGSGALTVVSVKKKLYQFYNDIPLCVKFIVLDTDSSLPQGLRVSIKGGEEWRLAEIEKNTEFMHLPVNEPQYLIGNSDFIKNWWPEELIDMGAISDGAGQFRARGRLAFHAHASDVRGAFSRLINEVTDAKLDEQMRDRQNLQIIGGSSVGVYIISSVAGGTGSGSFIDVGFLFRQLLPETQNKVSAFLFMPWIFEGLVGTHRIGINAYSALKELNYYMEMDYVNQRPRLIFGDQSFNADSPPFSIVNLIEGRNELGLHVKGKGFTGVKSLCDIVGTSIALTIGSVGQGAMSAIDNLEGYLLAQDPKDWDGKKPIYSSLGVCSIVYPIEKHYNKFYSYYAFHLIDELLRRLGWQPADDNTVEGDVDKFCIGSRLDERNNNIIDEILAPGQAANIQLPAGISSAAGLKDSLDSQMQMLMQTIENNINQNLNRKIDQVVQDVGTALRDRTAHFGPGYSLKFIEKLTAQMKSYHDDRLKDIQDREAQLRMSRQQMDACFNNEVQKMGFKRLLPWQRQKIFEDYVAKANGVLNNEMELKRRRAALKVYEEVINAAGGYILDIPQLKRILSTVRQNIESDLFTSTFITPHYGEHTLVVSEREILIKRKERRNKKELMFTLDDFKDMGMPIDINDFLNKTSLTFPRIEQISPRDLEDIVLKYAKDRTAILKDISIEDVLFLDVEDENGKMEKIKYYIEEASKRATPLWYHKAMADKADRMKEVFIIGTRDVEETRLFKISYSGTPTFTDIDDQYKLFFFKYKAPLSSHLLECMENYRREYFNASPNFTPHAEKDMDIKAEDIFPVTAEDELTMRIYTLCMARSIIKRDDYYNTFYIDDPRCLGIDRQEIELGTTYWSAFDELRTEKRKDLLKKLMDILGDDIKASPKEVTTSLKDYVNKVRESFLNKEYKTIGDKVLLCKQLDLAGRFIEKDEAIEKFIPLHVGRRAI